MNTPDRPRGFEDRLLSELKTYVSERTTMNTTEETPERTPRFRRVHKFSLAGGIGAVALGIGAIVALPTLTASPAYAVETKDDGNIYVEILNPEDAQDLENTLAEHGIKSKVDFPPDGMMCNPDRYTQADADNIGMESVTTGMEDDGDNMLGFDVNPDNYPLDGDVTLVIEVSAGFFSGDTSPQTQAHLVAIGAAEGEIGECDPVDAPLDENDFEDEETGDGGGKSKTEKKDDDGSKSKNED